MRENILSSYACGLKWQIRIRIALLDMTSDQDTLYPQKPSAIYALWAEMANIRIRIALLDMTSDQDTLKLASEFTARMRFRELEQRTDAGTDLLNRRSLISLRICRFRVHRKRKPTVDTRDNPFSLSSPPHLARKLSRSISGTSSTPP
ncbi:hypothetical protein AVEN_47643-1 [Araneus ventricosus]|uniref:Uncharacterized protein n=1 Tax=Araneus ventricosus TaxID=182803 RepID=A0A4Y2SMX8_ARAVE|nr:hypothetical protein AVEN_47643-1 [Araneus ventricosus]